MCGGKEKEKKEKKRKEKKKDCLVCAAVENTIPWT